MMQAIENRATGAALFYCMIFSLAAAFVAIVLSEPAYAHGGGLDVNGCHHDRKRGGYHCHRGELAGKKFSSRGEAEELLQEGPGNAGTATGSSNAFVPYDRRLYARSGWIDADGDCQNTRHEVLAAESTVPVVFDRSGCKVLAGRWEDSYTGLLFTDPRKLDIDHFIPLAEVHRSGGRAWTPAQRLQYANDLTNPDTLIAVFSRANRSKGDSDPARWLPPNRAYHCQYIRTWVALKAYWTLEADHEEQRFLKNNPCLKE